MMLRCLIALTLCLAAVPARADRLDEIHAGNGDPKAALAGVVVAYGTHAGAIAVARGCARFDADGKSCVQPLTPEHLMRVASISKLVTALGAMKLVEAGKLKLDDDVSEMLGFRLRNPAFPDTPITLAQLLSHTSSVRDGETYWAEYPDALASLFAGGSALHFDKDHAPGRYFTYTNLNYGLIGQLIERASGQRFDRYMREQVLAPLGIEGGYNWSGATSLPGSWVATLYRKTVADGPWVPQIDDFGGASPAVTVRAKPNASYLVDALPGGSNGSLFSPQGGLRISAPALARIARMIANCGRLGSKRFLRCSTINKMAEPVWQLKVDSSNGNSEEGFYQAYGLGPHRFHIDDSRELMIGHLADAWGLRGALIVNPATRKYGVYLYTGLASDPASLKSDVPGLSKPEADLMALLRDYLN
jgi:CubicO group peptidase (beta-lactamase class C family)